MTTKMATSIDCQNGAVKTHDALLDAIQAGIDDVEAGRYERFHSPEELETRILEIWDQAVGDVKAA